MQTIKEIWIFGGGMMIANIEDTLVRIVILDISGIYVQIHNQGYFAKESISVIRQQYSNLNHWRILVLDN